MTLQELVDKIIEKIEYEQGVKISAKLEAEMNSTTVEARRHLWRDVKRSESKIRAFEEVLHIALPEVGWKGSVKEYLRKNIGVV